MRCGVTLAVLLLLLAAPASAQEALQPPDLPPGEDRIEAVTAASRAPYDGMLLDMDTAIRWTNRLTWYRETLQLRLREASEVLAAVRQSHETEITVLRESYVREIEALRTDLRTQVLRYETELARHRDPPFYETWGFAFGMGALAMGVVVGVIGGLIIGL